MTTLHSKLSAMRYLSAPLTLISALVCCLALASASCDGNKDSASGNGDTKLATEDNAGIDFKKTTVGLRSHTLDYIGANPEALAGAKGAAKVFFGSTAETTTMIYCRDLNSGERSEITKIGDLVPGSLLCSTDGKYLVYGRWRDIQSYVDDPDAQYPKRLSLLHRYDVEAAKEEVLFDFRQQEFFPYRTDKQDAFVSADGSMAVALSYDLERLIVKKQLMDWLKLADDVSGGNPDMTDQEKTDSLEILRQLYKSPRIAPLLSSRKVAPPASGALTEEEKSTMNDIYSQVLRPHGALLIWENGNSRVLPLKFREDLELAVHYIVAAGNGHVLIGTRDPAPTDTSPYYIFDVNLGNGELKELATYNGAPSVMELDTAAGDLLLINNPLNATKDGISDETYLLRIPLDGSKSTEKKLPGNLIGYADITTDGSLIVAQERSDHHLYAVRPESGKKTELCQFVAEAGGIFLPDGGQRATYLENGILYAVNLSDNPPASDDWVDLSYFEPYRKNFTDFLSAIGFTDPGSAHYEFEEREGLGAHEVSATLSGTEAEEPRTFVRYSVKQGHVVSLWMPDTYPFPNTMFPLQPEPLDYYDCLDIAERLLNAAGWLNPDTREVYQPGPNPLYDGRSDTFIILVRDGYYIGEGDAREWVINKEATISIRSQDGSIVEMTLNERDPVESQPQTITLEKAVFAARNAGEQPIPNEAPITFDTENYRLVIGQKPEDMYGPVKYQMRKDSRLCYEIDAFIQPENELVFTTLVDTETGQVLGTLNFSPTSMLPEVMAPGADPSRLPSIGK